MLQKILKMLFEIGFKNRVRIKATFFFFYQILVISVEIRYVNWMQYRVAGKGH